MIILWLIVATLALIEIFSKPQKHRILSGLLSLLFGLAQGIFKATCAEKDYKKKIRH